MTDTDLLPCPFCGGKAHTGVNQYNPERVGCRNEKCPMRVVTVLPEEWNTRASTPSSTRANERGDLSDFIKHKQQVIERQMEKHTPHPSPQSDMVAVPREALKDVLCMIANRLNQDVVEEKSSGKLRDAYALLQPYTKGE